MKNKNIKGFLSVMILALALSVTACAKSNTKKDDGQTVSDTQDILSDDSMDSQESNDSDKKMIQDTVVNPDDSGNTGAGTKEESVEPAATKEISIYTLNESNLEVEMVSALVPQDSEITPRLIVDLVADSLADRLITVGIDEVTTKDDAVIVSFKSDQPPLSNVGIGLEDTILNAFAQSLVDNLKDKYPKVIFRKEGQAYTSGHLEFGINEVYLDGNLTK